MSPIQVMGIAEIADTLGMRPATVAQWYRRGKLPKPDAVLKMGPVWKEATIERWRKAREA
jgi:uncharacterized protein YjcR